MILALDIGTSTVKAGLFLETGACSGTKSVPIAMKTDENPLVHEIPAEAWLLAVRELSRSLLPAGAVPRCVVVSGNGPTLVPVDASGKPLHDAISWMDRRAAAEAEEVSEVAGSSIDPSFCLPKALWFMRKRPEIYEKTASFLSCPEFLIRILCGESRTILPAAGWERFFWDDGMLLGLGLDPRKFPRFVKPGTIIGTVGATGEAATGIPAGTAVVAGGPDFVAALVGTGTVSPGLACDRAGSSEGINLCAEKGVADKRLFSTGHVIEPFANISGSVSTSGKAVDWWKHSSGAGGASYEDFFEDLARSPPGCSRLVFLPYLSGERTPIWDPSARGVFLGLTLGHGARDMSRAVVESTAFAMRDIIEVMEGDGALVAELRVAGSPGRSPVWNRIKADVTGRPISVTGFAEPELLGDACIGFAALGDYASVAEAAKTLVSVGRTWEPDRSLKALYDDLFGVYRGAYEALKPVFKRLGEARQERSST